MDKRQVIVSIIIVHYKAKITLFNCLKSLEKMLRKTTISHEVIVVDNDEIKTIGRELRKEFPFIVYVKSSQNKGYGGGNNLGAGISRGKYIFFLNPDTVILGNPIDILSSFLERNNNVAIVAPLLVDKNKKIYVRQGFEELNPWSSIFALSFLGKVFPKNPVAKKYFLSKWNKKTVREVQVVPGTAFMIRADVFKKLGGFDKRFFLFFEEFDLCKRVKSMGYCAYIVPDVKIVHLWGESTKYRNDITSIFSKSRFYYFKKHYGLIIAFLTEMFLRINKFSALLILTTIIGAFIRIYSIDRFMPFIGDQGWFYLSARDMVLDGQIPLVGIPSSHPWLHQGPLWTYMLASIFWLYGFNPVNGAYLTIILGILTILLVYIVGIEMFSRRVGLMSAILYATSPLVVIHSRTPYHTSPIPLFTLLFIFSLYKWLKGNSIFFPLSIFFLAILYNLELATAVLWFVLLAVLGYGLWKKTEWIKKIFTRKILIYSFLAFLIPMIPILIYDFNNNFPQTLKFIVWIGYRIMKFFGFASIHGEIQSVNFDLMITFSFHFYQYLIFAGSNITAFMILILSFGSLALSVYSLFRKKIHDSGLTLLVLWILISFIGYFVNKTPSEAYLPIFFPALIYLVAFSFDKVMKIKMFLIPVVFLVIMISFVNSYFIISSNYFTNNKSNFTKKLWIAKEIVKKADDRDYNIVGKGNGSQFESFTMNYEYLTWWLGQPPSKFPQKLKYTVQENEKGVSLTENE